MTRAQVNRILMEMESIRMASLEADSVAEERRLDAEYGRLSNAIRPFINGDQPFSEPPATAPSPATPVTPPRTPEDGLRPSTPEDGLPVATRQDPAR